MVFRLCKNVADFPGNCIAALGFCLASSSRSGHLQADDQAKQTADHPNSLDNVEPVALDPRRKTAHSRFYNGTCNGGKLTLCSRNFRARRDKDLARHPADTLGRSNTRTGQHYGYRLFRYVRAYDRKGTVSHFQNLRAMIATFTEVGAISA
jgi:hypothetical protein